MTISQELTAAVLGVRLEQPVGDIEFYGDWMHIGSIVDPEDGTFLVVPRHGVGGNGTARLLAVAESFAISGRPQSPAWRYHPDLGWVIGVRVRLPHRVTEAEAVQCEEVRG